MFTKFLKACVALLFALGLLATGVLGTETRLLFFWPGAALLGLAGLVAALRWRWRVRFMPSQICLASALLFGVYFFARQLTSPVAVPAREDMFILLACAVVYGLTVTVLGDHRGRALALWVLLGLTVCNLAMGFVHFSGAWTRHIVPGYMRSFGEQRIGGFFNNSNHLATFLAMMALLSAAMTLYGRGGAVRKLMLAFLSLSAAIGIALTVSRGAMVGLAAGGVVLVAVSVWLLWATQRHLVGKVLLGVGVLGLLGGLVLYGVFAEQLKSRLGGGGFAEGDPRPVIWRAALAQHAESPWLGAGARMFYDGCITHRTQDSPPWMKDALFMHNDWLQALTDYGWVGFALVLVLVLVHFNHARAFFVWFAQERFGHTASLTSDGLAVTIGAVAAAVAGLVHAVFEFHLHVPATAVTMAFLFGCMANPGFTPVAQRPVGVPGARLLMKLAVLGASVILLYGVSIFGRADYYAERAEREEPDEDALLTKLDFYTRSLALDPANAAVWYARGSARLEAASGKP
ncbi:MAG: O-antigen ligase family protein, partial [Roseimicrobium sp.]